MTTEEKLQEMYGDHTAVNLFDFTRSIFRNVLQGLVKSYGEHKLPPQALLDTLMNVAAEEIAQVLASMVGADMITVEEARAAISDSGANFMAAQSDNFEQFAERVENIRAMMKQFEDEAGKEEEEDD